MWLLKNLPNNVLCHVGIRYGFKGTNACVTNQCAGGVMAMAEAAAAIRNGEADRACATGHDTPFEPETVFNYDRLGLLTVTLGANGLIRFAPDAQLLAAVGGDGTLSRWRFSSTRRACRRRCWASSSACRRRTGRRSTTGPR